VRLIVFVLVFVLPVLRPLLIITVLPLFAFFTLLLPVLAMLVFFALLALFTFLAMPPLMVFIRLGSMRGGSQT
jgi:hypothetical protein